MSFNSEYLKLRKKRLDEEKGIVDVKSNGGTDFDSEYLTLRNSRLGNEPNEDIAPVVTTSKNTNNKKESTWFDGGAFKDGYQFGDVFKTIIGSAQDLTENVYAGILGIGEGVVDAGAMLVGGAGGLLGNDKLKDKMSEFVAKDLYDEKEVAKFILGNHDDAPFNSFKQIGVDVEGDSVFGDKTDSLAQSGGQLLGTIGLQAVGVPWFVTTGVTGFGSAAEGALNEGATFEQAGWSAAISAGAEILTEKLFGGSGLGEKGLINLDGLTKGISSKVVKALADVGVDMAAEGSEEVISSVANRLGSKLYREERLGDLLFSEEAVDEYIDSFIGGAVLGGVMNTGKAVKSTQTGRDYRTGLTENEQKVFDRVYKERLAEAEKSGQELTKKEKAELYNAVLEDVQKGYISTDTIESELGGETYKSYKDTIDSEDAILKEYEELGKKQNATLAEQARYAELQAKVKEIQSNSKRSELKAKLSEEVYNSLTRQVGNRTQTDDFLLESYNENARRGKAFEADLSKYDTKMSETVKRAVESGILNNTRRTHEFVDMVAKISADKGVLFDFTNNAKLKESGFAIDGKFVNGYITKDGIAVNIDSHKSLNSVVGHEISHVLEGTELYTELQTALFEYAKSKKDYDSRRKSLEDLYKDVEGANVDAELTADLVGDYLFTDADFINNLSTKHRNVFQKVYDEIKYLLKVATAGSKEARELEKVKRAFDKAYKESGKVERATKYSLSDSDGKQLTNEQSEYFKDSKMRDDNGNLKVMYHGSQDAGFHEFNSRYSDDDTSFFFVDRNDVAASYSGTTETYEAQTIHTAEDMNNFIESIGIEGYEVVEKDGKFTLLYEGDRVADSKTAKGIYEEFCWYEGVGEGDANYKVYLNLTNPLEVDAKGRPWNKIDAEFSQEVYDKYQSLTAEEKAALTDLAEWEDFRVFNSEIQEAQGNELASAYAKMGEDCNIYDLFSVAADNFSEESLRENSRKYLKTRDYAQRAKEQGYDGVIFKNIVDNGGYSNGSEGASTVAIAFESNQIKSVANEKPTGNADIRYSLSEDGDTYSRIYDMQVEVNHLRQTIKEFEASDDFKSQMSKLSEAVANDDIANWAKAYAEWCKKSGYDELINRRDALQTELENLRKEYNDSLTNRDLEKERAAIAKSGLSEADYFRKQAVKEFGYTPFFYDAGYITTNGKMLNFSGEKGYHYGGRGQDHRAIGVIYANTEGSDALNRFVKDGNIRIMAESPGIDISTTAEPTKEQYATIRKFIYEYADKEFFNVDLTDENGRVIGSLQYENRINPIRILNDIKHYYATGEIRRQSDVDRFRYSLSKDTENRELSQAVKTRFANSKVVDENGSLKVVYHGTASGEFSIFDKSKGSVEGDFGSGFYFTDNEGDVSEHYEGGGPDFENKVARRAEQIESEEEIDYDEAEKKAREELFKGSHKFEVYLNIENPAIVGETILFDSDSYLEEYNEEDYEDYDDYIGDVEQLLADDVENIVYEVERNTGAYSTEGLAGVLYDAYYEGGIGIEELKAKINELYLEDENGNLIGNEVARQVIESLGYDGIIDPTVSTKWNMDMEEGTTHYIVFKPNQIKAVSNQNPTDNPDIHRSLSANGKTPKRYGNYNVFGADISLEVPTQEEVAPVDETVDETVDNAVANAENVGPTVEDMAEAFPSEPTLYDLEREAKGLEAQLTEAVNKNDVESVNSLLPKYTELTDKIKQRKAEESAISSERLASLDDTDAPPEMEAPYYDESENAAPEDPFESRDIKDVGNRKVKAYMYENPEVKPFFQAEANVMLREWRETTRGERWYNDELYYESGGEHGWSGTKRHASADIAYLLDNGKGNGKGYTYDEIEAGLKAIIEDNGKENNACSKRIEFLLNDRLLKGYQDFGTGYDVPPNQDYINLLNEKQISEYSEEARKKFFEVADEYAPLSAEEDIAPIAENVTKIEKASAPVEDIAPHFTTNKEGEIEGQQTMFEEAEEEPPKVAKILTEEQKVQKKKNRAFMQARAALLDKGAVVEDLSLKTGNRELQSKYNFMHYSESRAQEYIAEHLKPIVDKVEKSGKTEQLYEYMYHLHNIDRMSLETDENRIKRETLREKFKGYSEKQIENIAMEWIKRDTPKDTAERIKAAREYIDARKGKNKPVFGETVTADVSRDVVKQLEAENPEFKKLSETLIEYNTNLRKMLVDGNVISQITADLWAEMYPHYVPIRRVGKDGLGVTVPLDTNKTGVNAPIKGAKGGNSDILPLFDTMALRTEQTFKAIAKNNFGVELMHTLDSVVENEDANLDEVIDSFDNHDELLQKGKNGKDPTFTVFENGKRVTFEITEDLYDSIKPTSEGLKYTNKAASTASNIFRGILTEYNPVFMVSNAAKDVQDVLINSQHAAQTYANIPKAIKELSTKGRWYNEYIKNGGSQNTYFDSESKTFKDEDRGFIKTVGMPLRAISEANNFIERVPRLAEYIASREAGASIETAMLDAARITTNFAAGGDVTKALNRNGFTFLNASVQGFNQQVRNVREAKANGLKGWVSLASKVALAGLPAILLNNLLWDDDEEYEELSDYVKDNYYVVAKTEDGTFVRIPKGRTLAVIQDAFEQVGNALTGNDEVDLNNFLDLAISNLAPNNPLENNILAPIIQAANNKTWYGEDLVPTRLQDLPKAEQYDESTDTISKWLGENLNISPYKVNYLLNQYSGGIGDVFLPMLTPEAESGDDSMLGNIIAPIKDKFTTDSVMNNQNISDFYDTVNELTVNANSSNATDEDILKNKYMNSVSAKLGELYSAKREIQNSNLSDKVKYSQIRELQEQINALAKEGLSSYNNISFDGDYANIGDTYFQWYTPEDESEESYWRKLSEEQTTKYLVTKAAGNSNYATDGNVHYRRNENGEWTKISDKQLARQNEVTKALGITPEEYWSKTEISVLPMSNGEYEYAYDNPENYAVAKSVGGYDAYKTYSSELYDIKADKDEYGKSISGSRKEKVIDYVNNLDIDYGARLILFKSEYKADDTYNNEIIEYLNSREDISYEEMVTILKELGFNVSSDGYITWD